MPQVKYEIIKSSIKGVSNSKELFFKELLKASKTLLPHEKERLINWLFFYTADKPEMKKWLHEVVDKDYLVG